MGYVELFRRIQGLDELLCRKPQFSVMQGASQAAASKSRKIPPRYGRPKAFERPAGSNRQDGEWVIPTCRTNS
jgi:hypothetical protein